MFLQLILSLFVAWERYTVTKMPSYGAQKRMGIWQNAIFCTFFQNSSSLTSRLDGQFWHTSYVVLRGNFFGSTRAPGVLKDFAWRATLIRTPSRWCHPGLALS